MKTPVFYKMQSFLTRISWLLLFVLLLCVLATGCARRYQITLNNGNRITTLGKPKYAYGKYFYKDLSGETNWVSETRVREIGPRPRGYTEETGPTLHPSQR